MMADLYLIIGLVILLASAVILFTARAFILQQRDDEQLLDFLGQAGYSLQCLNHRWAVTDGSAGIVGRTADTPRDAIRSAAGALATGKEVNYG